jgi:solute carrier family 31 (copper transporter), member 1
MLWNWNTIGSCFISMSWHIESYAKFGATCVCAIILVMGLEFFRRLAREWDRHLLAKHAAKFEESSAPAAGVEFAVLQPVAAQPAAAQPDDIQPVAAQPAAATGPNNGKDANAAINGANPIPPFRPNIWQQAFRALLHMVQFAVAYFIMLLAMSFNGYIIISIFIGAYFGAFAFQWDKMSATGNTSTSQGPTVCCG